MRVPDGLDNGRAALMSVALGRLLSRGLKNGTDYFTIYAIMVRYVFAVCEVETITIRGPGGRRGGFARESTTGDRHELALI